MTKKYNVIYVPGTWDLFHVGHLRLLRRASKITDWLIVGIDTDESIKKDKGVSPIIPYKERVKLLEACRYVDEVTQNNHTVPPVSRLKKLDVEAVVLGSDWKKKYLVGKNEAKKKGVNIVYFSYTKGISTTKIKERILK